MQHHFLSLLLSRVNLFFLLFIVSVVPVIFLPGINHSEYNGVKEVVFEIVVILFFFIFIINVYFGRKYRINFNWIDVLVVLIPIASFLGNLTNHQMPRLEFLTYLSFFYILVKLTFSEVSLNTEKIVFAFLSLLAINNLFLCGVCFLQATGVIPYSELVVYDTVVIGAMGNPNGVGSFLSMSILFLVGFLHMQRTGSYRYIIIVIIMLDLAVLVITKSRGAYIALSVGLMIYYYQIIFKTWLSLVHKVGKVVVLLIIFFVLSSLFYSLVQMNVSSSFGRIYLARICLLMFKDSPIHGVGYGNYFNSHSLYQTLFFSDSGNRYFYDYASNLFHPSNQFLYVLSEGGLIGLLLFLLILAVTSNVARKMLKSDFPEKDALRIFFAAFISIYVHSLFDSPLYYASTKILFYFTISFISFLSVKALNDTKPTMQGKLVNPNSLFSFFIVIPICVFLVLFGMYSINDLRTKIQGFYLWRTGQIFAAKYDWIMSSKYYEKATGLLPDNGRLNFHCGVSKLMNSEYRAALDNFNKAEESYRSKDLYVRRALIHFNLSDYELAERDYISAIRMYPNLLSPRLKLGELYYKTGQVSRAKEFWESILVISPKIINENSTTIKKQAQRYLDDKFYK